MEKFVIIVAGGNGSRMLTETPKQFLTVVGKPILMHTINSFFSFDPQFQIILVLPKPFFDFWHNLIKRHEFDIQHKIVAGGKSRFKSVKNGLQLVDPKSLVAIHDGVRPMVSFDTINRVYKNAAVEGNAIPVIGVTESIRKVEGIQNNPVDRNKFFLVQTPQCFQAEKIIKAYDQSYKEDFTDDASVLESIGETIYLVEGNIENIKITTPFDLKIAEAYFS